MSLYVSSNKPRSLLRQSHYLTSHGPSLPSNVEHSLEQWLQKGECMPSPLFAASSSQPPELWNKSSSSSTSSQSSSSNTSTDDHPSPVTLPAEDLLSVLSPHDAPLPCPCCQQDQCLSWCRTSNIMRKLDAELRLAAEIGQNLLQKNETLTLESSQIKDQLEQAYERRGELEASLNEAEALAQRLNREKDKWLWQYEKSEKILQETIADLETTNYKCAALSQEFEQAKMDLEKLQLFKLKSQQADSRETLLQAKVNDLDQELTIARKNELTLESKYKKLVARYESVACAYQDLCDGTLKPSSKSNTRLIKVLTSLIPPTAAEIQQASTDELVDLIQELVSTNHGLKIELAETQSQLDDTRSELTIAQEKWHALEDQQDQRQLFDLVQSPSSSSTAHRANATKACPLLTTLDQRANTQPSRIPTHPHRSPSLPTSPVHPRRLSRTNTGRSRSRSLGKSKSPTRSQRPPVPKPTVSTPPAVHHHHYYYLPDPAHPTSLPASVLALHQDDNRACLTEVAEVTETAEDETEAGPLLAALTLDPVSIPPLHLTDEDRDPSLLSSRINGTSLSEEIMLASPSPYAALHDHVRDLMQRLASTDIRALNRRLQRAFDIVELSQQSNALLQNVVADADVLDARFLWLTQEKHHDYRFLTREFIALVHLLQDVLKEYGQLNITMNHLQVAYVTKMELLQETQLPRTHGDDQADDVPPLSPASPASPVTPLNPIAWLSTLFVNNDSPPALATTPVTPSAPPSPDARQWPSLTSLFDDLRQTNAKTATATTTLDAKWTPSFPTKWLGSDD